VSSDWKEWDDATRLAVGRKRFNSARQSRAAFRRTCVARLLYFQGSMLDHGVQARIARELGVSRSTISRDVAYLLRLTHTCPHCGALTTLPDPPQDDPGI
jgi:hypothetical protein